jgi:succinate dehydrogenase / fumarate reductase membrane anchor subunit
MSLESPLGKFLGHGSAKDGTDHWWSQRVTAVALIPLTLWFVIALLGMGSFEHAAVAAWMAKPLNAILMILLLVAILYHSQLGLQVVIEDYVHSGAIKIPLLMVAKFVHVAAGVAAIYSIIIVSLGVAVGNGIGTG